MGVYDILPKGSQVKCWKCEMKRLDIGSKVGKIEDFKNYIVVLREGGYVKVIKRKIRKIVEEEKIYSVKVFKLPVFDKYGDRIYEEPGLMGILINEEYYFDFKK